MGLERDDRLLPPEIKRVFTPVPISWANSSWEMHFRIWNTHRRNIHVRNMDYLTKTWTIGILHHRWCMQYLNTSGTETGMFQVVNTTAAMSWLLASPGHQQSWYWGFSQDTISMTLAISVLRNDRKCEYIFMLLDINLVQQGLRVMGCHNEASLKPWQMYWSYFGLALSHQFVTILKCYPPLTMTCRGSCHPCEPQ